MADTEEKKAEVEQPKPEVKKTTKRVIAMVVGILLVVVGFFSFCENEELNDALIEVGAGQSVKNMVEEYPQTKEWAIKIADTIEAAIEARTASPDKLTSLIQEAVGDSSVPGLRVLVETIITQINTTHAQSATEQEYTAKLLHLVAGIRDGIGCATPPDVE